MVFIMAVMILATHCESLVGGYAYTQKLTSLLYHLVSLRILCSLLVLYLVDIHLKLDY